MGHKKPDRVPVMCQLSLGHYFLNCEHLPSEIWFDSETFARSLIELQESYQFDGVLINLPGRPSDWRKYLASTEKCKDGEKLVWKNGFETIVPPDDNPHTYSKSKKQLPFSTFESIDLTRPATFYSPGYIWNAYHMPCLWGFDSNADLTNPTDYPASFTNILKAVKKITNDISVQVEVFSPFTHFLEMFGYEEALMGLLIYPETSKKILEYFTKVVLSQVAVYVAEGGIDAILVSSAFAGAGFISRHDYENFVMPYEDIIFKEIKNHGLFSYVHTCGSIGDRLDLMAKTSVDGVDTLDPPPLGTVHLKEAKEIYGQRFFLKGNLDSINELLNVNDETFEKAVIDRLITGKPGSGYILSTACSVSPYVKPYRLRKLVELSTKHGTY